MSFAPNADPAPATLQGELECLKRFWEASPQAVLIQQRGTALHLNAAAAELLGSKLEGKTQHPGGIPGLLTDDTAPASPATECLWKGMHEDPIRLMVSSWPISVDGQAARCMLLCPAPSIDAQEEDLFRNLSEAVHEGIAIHNGTHLIASNSAFARLFGYTPGEIAGRRSLDFFSPLVEAELEARMRNNDASPCESIGLRKDGSTFPVELSAQLVMYQGQQVRVGTVRDIRDRQQYLGSVLDSLFVMVAVLALDGQLVELNRAPLATIGVRKAELLGRPFTESPWWSSLPLERERLRQAIDRARRGEQTRFDVEIVHIDGRRGTLDLMIEPLRDSAGQLQRLILSAVEITERKSVERALQESEATLATILGNAPFLIGMVETVDDDIVHLFDNPATERFFGVMPGGTRGRRSSEMGISREIIRTFLHHYEEARRLGQPVQFDGSFKVSGRDRWRRSTVAYVGPGQQGPRFCYLAEDITERKRSQDALQRSNAALSQLARASAHDLQEPLRNIAISAQLLYREHASQVEPNGLRLMNECVVNAKRMHRMVLDLLTFTEAVDDEERWPGATESRAALETVILVLAPQIEEAGAKITRELLLPPVAVHPHHLEQIFSNLIINGLKFRSPATAPEISITAERSGDQTTFHVTDNGIGFAPEYAERIFGVFKRLHLAKEYAGTGIGLAVCARIVEHYGGRIWARSKPGQGATFSFALPTAE